MLESGASNSLQKHIAVIGSTGSIGMQTLDVVRAHPEDFRVVSITANRQTAKLIQNILEFRPEFVGVRDEQQAIEIRRAIPFPIEVGIGKEGLIGAVTWSGVHLVVNAVVGAVGIQPTIVALQKGIDVALANKETLVAAGELVWAAAHEGKASIIPVDSEHSAIMQCLLGNDISTVNKLVLTASGGPFRGFSRDMLERVTVADALAHPTWKMGAKITVDSATLMNKGFEIIEAHYLYHTPYDQIDVVVHPQSIIHSMVYYKDGAVMAQLGTADMRIPIQFAMYGGNVRVESPWLPLDLTKINSLSFEAPDRAAFPALDLAYDCGRAGGTYPAVLNAANEVAALAFLEGQLPYIQIVNMVAQIIEYHQNIASPTLDQVMEVDAWAREEANRMIREGRASS